MAFVPDDNLQVQLFESGLIELGTFASNLCSSWLTTPRRSVYSSTKEAIKRKKKHRVTYLWYIRSFCCRVYIMDEIVQWIIDLYGLA